LTFDVFLPLLGSTDIRLQVCILIFVSV